MKLNGRIERKGSRVIRKRAALLSSALTPIAKQGERAALLHARRGLELNVYGTVSGEYDRTGHLRTELFADSVANAGTLGITVGDRAPYASEIEFGTGPYELNQAQLQAYLDALPRGGLLRFGRTGQAYLLPGPYVGPALMFARTLTRERLNALTVALWS